ncbi:hypothetical protein [Halobacteriovorax sp. JY17]|uniref:hypothetical protein n=1 Tax=Halobacteriovorax sp. JY17 TaxID=2014617 RepID=UPI000C364E76|nr:hypothetical protein [Halobacteriovorax sp. JY17]PIK13961.1 MAG: hypothetical protein CES88_13325 [Halobacteriovorax sp. JY17]
MNKILIISLLILCSCDRLYKSNELISQFENHLKLAFTLESGFSENSSFTTGNIIERPAGSWQNLISSDHYCLNYKIPVTNKEGILQIVEKLSEQDCPSLPTSNELISVEGIKKLKVKFSTDHIQGKSVRNGVYGITMSYLFKEKERIVNITLPNKLRSKDYIRANLAKYSSSGTYRQSKGVRITQANRQTLMTSLWFGDWDLKEREEIDFCEKKNDRCEITGSSNCGDCLYGWEYLVDYNCVGGGSKACSPVKCGEKGRPACPRGVLWSGKDIQELCFDDSPAGFCQDDLQVICGEDGVLICI